MKKKNEIKTKSNGNSTKSFKIDHKVLCVCVEFSTCLAYPNGIIAHNNDHSFVLDFF